MKFNNNNLKLLWIININLLIGRLIKLFSNALLLFMNISFLLVLNIFNITPLFFHLFLLYNSIHIIIYWKIFQFLCVFPFIEHQLKFIILSIRTLMFLTRWDWRWWENRINRNSKFQINLKKYWLTLKHSQPLQV